jgi:hypothetical protein
VRAASSSPNTDKRNDPKINQHGTPHEPFKPVALQEMDEQLCTWVTGQENVPVIVRKKKKLRKGASDGKQKGLAVVGQKVRG